MNILSNQHFWNMLAPQLRRLFPHCAEEEYAALTMLMRVMQAVMYASDTQIIETQEPYCELQRHVPQNVLLRYDAQTYRRSWSNTISGIPLEVEWVKVKDHFDTLMRNTGSVKSDGNFVITSENWEVVITFERDPVSTSEHSFGQACYFLKEAIMLETMSIEGNISQIVQDMVFAALSVADMETGDVFYEGSPW